MATKGKTVSVKKKGGRKAASNKKTKKNKAVPNKVEPNPLTNEIFGILFIAVGIILAVSLFTHYGTGFAGDMVNGVVRGMFGIGANLLPFIIIGGGIYSLFDSNRITLSRFFMALGLFICLITLAHVLGYQGDAAYNSFPDYLMTNYRNGSSGNGGLTGAIFGNFLLKLFDVAGTYIFLTATILVLLILLTGKSFFRIIFLAVKKIISVIKSITDNIRTGEGEYDEDYYDENYYDENYYDEKHEFPETSLEKPKEKTAGKVTAKAKAPVFTINERQDGDGTKINLPQEEISKSSRPSVVIKGYNSKNISDIITIGPDGEKLADTGGDAPWLSEGEKGFTEVHENVDDVSEKAIAETESGCPGEFSAGGDAQPPAEEDWFDEVKISGNIDGAKNEQPPVTFEDEPEVPPSRPEIKIPAPREKYVYRFPPIDFLLKNPAVTSPSSRASILETSRKLEETLKSFNVEAKVIEVSKGPTVTRYELSPGQGVKVSKISGLADDLALNLAASGIRIEAPIPGKAAVGIEVPNKEVTPVYLREVISDEVFKNFPSKLAFALGKDIAGNTVVTDIARMPHLLIAGATGSGKSVCINTLITSIIYKANPDEVKLLMVDPKVVELSVYNGIPHLLIPVVTDPKKAAGALNWAVREMIARYGLFAETSVRDLKGYNAVLKDRGEEPLPQIVIIIDELADLMMAAPGEVEDSICRLAQMARAAGLHLIIATQRPSVDVITGLIKANVPSRLAFSVSSGTDSRTILDMVGAEKLLGKGDMLFFPVGMSKPLRVQGAFISDKEVENIVNYVKKDAEQEYDQDMIDKITAPKSVGEIDEGADEFLEPSIEFIIEKEKASASMLQRKFRIGYNRASNIIEELEARGIVGPEDGSKPRKVLMTKYAWEEYKANNKGVPNP